MMARSEPNFNLHDAAICANDERDRPSAKAENLKCESSAQIPQQPKLERVEVPPYKNKVWQSFENTLTDKLTVIKEEALGYDPDLEHVAGDFSTYVEEVIKALAPNFRKLTTTLYDSEATAPRLANQFCAPDDHSLLVLRKQNESLLESISNCDSISLWGLLEGIKFMIAKSAALQRKSVGDTQKQATAMYSNSLAQVQKEFEGLIDPTEPAGAAMENALKDQTTVHNIRWKKTVSGHNQTCNEGVQRVAEGIKLYQQLRKQLLKKDLAWSTEWACPAEYETILQERDAEFTTSNRT